MCMVLAMASEKNFEIKVRRWLEDHGAWVLKTWSNGVQRAGVPDLLVCYRGHFLGIEIKAQRGKLSKLQLVEIKRIKKAGGVGVVLYPSAWEQFKDAFERIPFDDTEFWGGVWK